MFWRNKSRKHAQGGFTLLELVMSLVLVGLIGAGISNTVVYAVRVYRSVVLVNETLPQLDTAVSIVRRAVRTDNEDGLEFQNGTLMYDGQVILGKVSAFSLTQQTAFENSTATVTRVRLAVDVGGKNREVIFDVCPSQK